MIPRPQTYKDFDVLNCSYGWTFLTQTKKSILISTWEIYSFNAHKGNFLRVEEKLLQENSRRHSVAQTNCKGEVLSSQLNIMAQEERERMGA